MNNTRKPAQTRNNACTDFKIEYTTWTSSVRDRIFDVEKFKTTFKKLKELKDSDDYQSCASPGIKQFWQANCSALASKLSELQTNQWPWESSFENYDYGTGEFYAQGQSNYCRSDETTKKAQSMIVETNKAFDATLGVVTQLVSKLNDKLPNDNSFGDHPETLVQTLDLEISFYQNVIPKLEENKIKYTAITNRIISAIPAECAVCR